MSDKSNYTDVLLEDINSKFDAVLEVVGGLQTNVNKIPKMAERIEKLESDMSLVKLATRVTSNDMNMVKIRTEKLERILEDVTDLQKRIKTLETA